MCIRDSLYAVLLVATLSALTTSREALALALMALRRDITTPGLVAPLATALVSGVVWVAHWRVARADRAQVERSGPNATLRRWYMVLMLWASLGLAAFGAGALISALLQRFVFGQIVSTWQVTDSTATLVIGLSFWLAHELWSRRLVRVPGPLQADELASSLRQVYLALVIVAALIASLTGLTALLAAAFRLLWGVETWPDAFAAQSTAAAALAVALPVLFYHREQMVLTARLSGAEERVGTAQRLISYLVGAVSLVALYFGLSGLIATLLRSWVGAEVIGEIGREALSWYMATTIVTLPVYGLASRWSERLARSSAEEERAVSRRIYLYAGLLFGVIAGVVALTQFIRLLLVTLLGQGGPGVITQISELAGYAILGAAIAVAYAAGLRRAGAARGALGAGWRVGIVAGEPLRQALVAALGNELPGATLIVCDEGEAPERRASLAGADLLVLSLAAWADPTLAPLPAPRLLLAAAPPDVTLVGARRDGPALAREAARKARALYLARPPVGGALAQRAS
ncbi:MAG: DUF5671 domain-containing protein, partial [Chloroflexaceae bacterium]|nr:DUF5671 domain-containing protein [Chloroflexaceae bacterium]